MLSKLIWILSGFAVHIGLGRYMGPKVYGIFGVILSIISVLYLILANGVRQGMTKFAADNPGDIGAIKKTGFMLQMLLALILTSGLYIFAGHFSLLLKDITLTKYIRLSALTVPFTAVYFCNVGIMNGAKDFGRTALSAMVYSISKVVFIFLLILAGLQVWGAIWGLVLAVMSAAIVSTYLSRHYKSHEYYDPKAIFNFSIPVLFFYVAIALFMHIDILCVKSITKDYQMAGYYTSISALSRMIYFVFQTFSILMLPFISNALKNNDMNTAKRYINQSLRYMFMLLLPIVLIIKSFSYEIIKILYTDSYLPAAPALGVLVFGLAFLSVILALSSIVQGFGKPQVPMIILLILIPVDILLNYQLIPRYCLTGAATATTITCFTGMLILGGYVIKQFGPLINVLSLLKISFAALSVYFISISYRASGVMLPVFLMSLASVYIILLFITGELNIKDLGFVREIKGNMNSRSTS
jgi:O-antigen/teichoic acid export membrane protein